MHQVIIEERLITKITANPMLRAGPVFLETPINGQSPKNLKRMKLLMKILPIIMERNKLRSTSAPQHFFGFSLWQLF